MEVIDGPAKDNKLFGKSQQRFSKGKSWFTNFIAFSDKTIHSVDKGNTVNVRL